jgi:hypothetical protein
MNTNYKEALDKETDTHSEAISGIIGKMKEKPADKKEGVSLVDITKKLAEKKFGKKKT